MPAWCCGGGASVRSGPVVLDVPWLRAVHAARRSTRPRTAALPGPAYTASLLYAAASRSTINFSGVFRGLVCPRCLLFVFWLSLPTPVFTLSTARAHARK
jgi:hypothetical protein